MPLPMRMPEEPPLEPSPFIMPNLYCPVDPDTPYNFEIEPREEEYHLAPLEPMPLRKPYEPDDPPYPERMIKSSTEEMMSEKPEEPIKLLKSEEPEYEPSMSLPKREVPILPPLHIPSKFEPACSMQPSEPSFDDFDETISENEP